MTGDKVRILGPKKGFEESVSEIMKQEGKVAHFITNRDFKGNIQDLVNKKIYPFIATIGYEDEVLTLIQINTSKLYNLDVFDFDVG